MKLMISAIGLLTLTACGATPSTTSATDSASSTKMTLVFQDQTDGNIVTVLVKKGETVLDKIPCTETTTGNARTDTCEDASYSIFLNANVAYATGTATVNTKVVGGPAASYSCKLYPVQNDGVVTSAYCK